MHHSERLTYILIILVIIVVGGAIWTLAVPRVKTTQIFLGNSVYSMSVVESDEALTKALKKPDALNGNKGVIVAYSKSIIHPVSLKNLREKSDVIWLNAHKELIYQTQNLPAADIDKDFGPGKPSKYILFFRSGIIKQQNIKLGSTVDFDLNSLW